MRRAVGRILVFLIAASLCIGGSLVASAAEPIDPATPSAWDEVISPPSGDAMITDPLFQEAEARDRAHYVAEQMLRSSSGARPDRDRSRLAFSGLSDGDARQLAQGTFAGFLAGPSRLPTLPQGSRITAFRAANVASVVDSSGRGSLLVGSEPFAVRNGKGFESLNLGLVDDGASYQADRPAIAVSIPKEADGFLSLPRTGLSLRPSDAEPSPASISSDQAFYGNVASDTDYVLTPTPGGAEVMWQLRSEKAPETLGLDLGLPNDATVRLDTAITSGDAATGQLEVVRGDTILDTISPPQAVDADGTSVPAEFQFDNGHVVVAVPHRGRDVHYPIMVDPEVHEVWGSTDFINCGGGPSNFQPGVWTYQQWVTPFTPLCGSPENGTPGLFVLSGPTYFGDTARGQWIWSAPAGAYIMSVWFDGVRHMASGTHLYTGLYGQSWGAVYNDYGDIVNGQRSYTPNSPYNSWTAVMGLFMDGAWTRPHDGLAGITGVNIRLGDLDPPTVALASSTPTLNASNQTPWLDTSSTTPTATVTAADGSLGLQDVGVVQDGWTGGSTGLLGSLHSSCAGYRSSPCARSWTAAVSLSGQIPEGVTAVHTWARDIVDNSGYGPYWYERVDRSPPTITLSGELYDHAQDSQLSANPSIYVHAVDGATTSASTQRSGVERVRMLLDGVVQQDYRATESSCDNCDRGLTWSLPETSLAGSHTVRFEAWDYLGHYAYKDLPVVVSASHVYGGADQVIDTPNEVASVVNAMANTTAPGRQALWSGMDSGSQTYYVNTLLPGAMANRAAYGMSSDEASVRAIFADPTTQGTLAAYDTPMTTSEQTSFEADAPPTNLYSGSIDIPEGEDNLDDGSGDPGTVIGDDTGFGCDPTEISGCDDAATYSDSQSDTGSDEVASSSATLTSGTDSGGGGSWFNRTGAVADADAHAHNARGGLYSRLGSSDCTNFVSQAWHFGGGLHMTKYWNIRHAFNPNLSLSNWTRKWTASWGAVRNFVDYMVNHRQIASIMTISPSAPYTGGEIGDAVEYDWGYGDGWSHLALIVRTGSTNDDLIDQHNYDRFRSSWRRGYEQQQDPTVRRAMRTRVVHVHVQ